jgi:hypothetical protein
MRLRRRCWLLSTSCCAPWLSPARRAASAAPSYPAFFSPRSSWRRRTGSRLRSLPGERLRWALDLGHDRIRHLAPNAETTIWDGGLVEWDSGRTVWDAGEIIALEGVSVELTPVDSATAEETAPGGGAAFEPAGEAAPALLAEDQAERPKPTRDEYLIAAWRQGVRPGSNIDWNEFATSAMKACGVPLRADGKLARGFSVKRLQDRLRELRREGRLS